MGSQIVLFNKQYEVSNGTTITFNIDYNSKRGTRNPSISAFLERTNSGTIDWAIFQIYETKYDDEDSVTLNLDKNESEKTPFYTYFNGIGITKLTRKIFYDCPKDNFSKPGVLMFTTFFAIIDTMCSEDFVKWNYDIKLGIRWGFKHLKDGEMCPITPSSGSKSDLDKLKDLLATKYSIHSINWNPVK